MHLDLPNLSPTAAGTPVKNQRGHWTFLPNLLPPSIDWTPSLIRQLELTTTALSRLDGALSFETAGVPAKALARPLLKREAMFSSKIEQIQTSIADLSAFEATKGRSSNDAATSETANYLHAQSDGLEHLRNGNLTCSLIKALHQRLLDGVRGQEKTPGAFRAVQNFIGNESLETARYIPPPPEHVPALMDNLEQFMLAKDELPQLIRIAITHYQFEAIHPFGDGNGRVGRLLIMLQLVGYKLLTLPVLYASAYFERNRRAYYDNLLNVSLEGSWNRWIEFFLEGVRVESEDVFARVKLLTQLQKQYNRRVATVSRSSASLQLVKLIMSRLAITTQLVSHKLRITPQAANQQISRLVSLGILKEITGQKRNRVYLATEVIDLLNRDLQNSEPPPP